MALPAQRLHTQMADPYSPYSNGDAASNSAVPNGVGNGSAHHGLPPIVRKKLMGYVGFANLPNQVHRKSVKKGFHFTTMVVGTCCGHHFLVNLF